MIGDPGVLCSSSRRRRRWKRSGSGQRPEPSCMTGCSRSWTSGPRTSRTSGSSRDCGGHVVRSPRRHRGRARRGDEVRRGRRGLTMGREPDLRIIVRRGDQYEQLGWVNVDTKTGEIECAGRLAVVAVWRHSYHERGVRTYYPLPDVVVERPPPGPPAGEFVGGERLAMRKMQLGVATWDNRPKPRAYEPECRRGRGVRGRRVDDRGWTVGSCAADHRPVSACAADGSAR